MDKNEFFGRWEFSYRVTRETIKLFPPDTLGKTIIDGLRPPGELFYHIFSHMNATLNACVSGTLKNSDLTDLPDGVDTTNLQQVLRYAQDVMEQVFAHASVSGSVWDQVIDTPWGEEPMRRMCFDSFGHEMHHRGQLYAMLRLLSITPPRACAHE